MKVIAITGGIASGKSEVTKTIAAAGYPIVDADVLARQVLEPGTHTLEQVKQFFGESIIKNGVLDRKTLGERVFSNPNALKVLTNLTAPEIKSRIQDQLSFFKIKGKKLVFCAIPLFFEQHYEDTGWFDQVVVVSTTTRQQLDRLMSRDHLREWEAQSRIKAQMPADEKVKRADVVIENNGSEKALQEKVNLYLQGLEEE